MERSRTRRIGIVIAAVLALALIPHSPSANATPVSGISVDAWSALRSFLPATAVAKAETAALEVSPRDRGGRGDLVCETLPTAAGAPSEADAGDGAALLVEIDRRMPVTRHPGGGSVIGTMPATSRYYDEPIVAWVQDVARGGRVGLVTVPYVAGAPTGWIALEGLQTTTTRIAVEADLSRHEIVVTRGDEIVLRAPAATGAAATPTPPGAYFVTDRVAFSGNGPYGSFAFGISGIQPDLPAGWSGGDQLAIHGTSVPSSIGTSASAGCLRVSERVLDRLERLLDLGTPVVIQA